MPQNEAAAAQKYVYLHSFRADPALVACVAPFARIFGRCENRENVLS